MGTASSLTVSIMQIFVKDIEGKTLALDVAGADAVHTVKECIHTRSGIPCDEQRLVFAGRELDDDASLAAHGIGAECKLTLALRLEGGGLTWGKMGRFQRITSYSLSPFRQSAWKGFLKDGAPNLLRRFNEAVWDIAPGLGIPFAIAYWATNEHARLQLEDKTEFIAKAAQWDKEAESA